MNLHTLLLAGLMFSIVTPCFSQDSLAASCPPTGYNREQLTQLKQTGFVVPDDEARNSLAIGLMGCLSDPDPQIRDGVAFEAVSGWLRTQQLSEASVRALYDSLKSQIVSDQDPAGFQQPFAALLLSEVVRADRVEVFMTPAMRENLVSIAEAYLAGVNDYRGFSESEGWRHGVAHGSDLVLQLVLNPKVGVTQIERLMTALATQVAPAGGIFYIYGEPGRLARAVYYAYSRGIVPEAFWTQWMEGISNPQPLPDWGSAFSSQVGLAKRNNTLGFLLALHQSASLSDDDKNAALEDLVRTAIIRVSG